MEKVTIMEQINAISFEGLTEDQFDFLVERAKKSVRKSNGKHTMTARQKENEGLKADFLVYLQENAQGATATAIGEEFDLTNQRASAILKQMVDAGDVIKEKDGKVTLFKVVTETEE